MRFGAVSLLTRCWVMPTTAHDLRHLSFSHMMLKGHSKWQNIRHTKASRDIQTGRMIAIYQNRISIAIKENGNQRDPTYNRPLAKVLEEARVHNIPNSSLQKALKAKDTANLVELTTSVRGPGNSSFVIEGLAPSLINFNSRLNQVLKKFYSIEEKHRMSSFQHRGVVIVEQTEDVPNLERAEEIAIEADCEEVEQVVLSLENIEDGEFVFFCDPRRVGHISKNLEEFKCKLVSAEAVYVPIERVEISEKAYATANRMADSLQSLEVVVGIHHNIEPQP